MQCEKIERARFTSHASTPPSLRRTRGILPPPSGPLAQSARGVESGRSRRTSASGRRRPTRPVPRRASAAAWPGRQSCTIEGRGWCDSITCDTAQCACGARARGDAPPPPRPRPGTRATRPRASGAFCFPLVCSIPCVAGIPKQKKECVCDHFFYLVFSPHALCHRNTKGK